MIYVITTMVRRILEYGVQLCLKKTAGTTVFTKQPHI